MKPHVCRGGSLSREPGGHSCWGHRRKSPLGEPHTLESCSQAPPVQAQPAILGHFYREHCCLVVHAVCPEGVQPCTMKNRNIS